MIDPAKKVFSLAEEFKNFALKGNVIDLAVAVVIGGAFNKIITSLVDNIINPLISIIMPSNQHFTNLVVTVPGTAKAIPIGHFLGDVVTFLIIALAMFLFVVKFLGFIMRSKQEAPPPPPTKDQELLMEIRDLLKAQQTK